MSDENPRAVGSEWGAYVELTRGVEGANDATLYPAHGPSTPHLEIETLTDGRYSYSYIEVETLVEGLRLLGYTVTPPAPEGPGV